MALTAMSMFSGSLSMGATDGTWTSTTSGTWDTSTNWLGGTIATGTGGTVSTADFTTLTMPSNITVSLASQRTIGVLKFGDVGGAFNWTVDNGGVAANSIYFVSNTYGGSTANQPTFNVVNGTATISANVGALGASPFPQWIKSGNGTVALTGVTTMSSGFNINGGTSASAASTVTINNAASNLGVISDPNNFFGYRDINIANSTGEFGVLNLTAGTVKAPNLTMGAAGNATVNVSGGTLSVGTRIKSSGNSNGKATVNISSGNLNFMNNAFFQLGEFNGSSTVFTTVNQTGGNVNFYSDNGVTLGGTGEIGVASGGSHIYNLSGGTLATSGFKFYGQAVGSFSGGATFYFKGGTLKATTATTDFWGSTTSTVGSLWFLRASSGAAIFDTAGNNVSFGNRGLVHDSLVTTDGGLTKIDSSGSGTLTIATNSSYNGPTSVQGGKLLFSNAMPTASTTFAISSGATLEFNHSTNTSITNANFSGAGTLIKSGTNTLLLTGASVSGNMSAGSLIDVQGGTLQLTDFNSLQTAWNSGSPNLNIASGAKLEANLSDVKVDALTGAGTYQSGWFFYRTLTVGVNGGSGTFSGVIQNNGVGGANVGATALTKAGSGTEVLTGANTFNGPLTITGGTTLSPSTLTIAPITTATIGLATSNALNMSNTTGDNTVLNVSGGSVSYAGGQVGQAGKATINLSGGSINMGGVLTLAGNNNGSANINVSGTGSLNVYSNNKLRFGQFFGRPTVVTQTGGNVAFFSDAGTTLGGTGGIEINGGSSTYTLTGGTLSAPQLSWVAAGGGAGGGNLTVNFNGGTLKTVGASTDFFPTGHVTTNVSTGGAIVDTNTNNVTINQVLAHDTALGATPDGGLTKSNTGTLKLTNNSTYTGATTVNGGTLEVAGTHDAAHAGYAVNTAGTLLVSGSISPIAAPAPVNVTGAGQLQVSNTGALRASALNSTTNVVNNGTVTVTGAGTSTIKSISGAGALTINAGTVVISALAPTPIAAASEVGSLSFSGSGALDIKNNAVQIHSTDTTDAARDAKWANVTSGQNNFDNNGQVTWDGPGIVSSTARSNNVGLGVDAYVVGVINNHDLAKLAADGGAALPYDNSNPWLGTVSSVGADDILVRMTYAGDTNLDGQITIDDYNNIDGTFGGLLPTNYGWASGDFDFNGAITIDDYNAIDSGFLYQGGQLTQAMIAQRTAMFGADYVAHLEAVAAAFASVPEPTSVGLLAVGAMGLMSRRRRKA